MNVLTHVAPKMASWFLYPRLIQLTQGRMKIWAAVATQNFFCLNNDLVLVLGPWICQSVCLQS